MRVGEVGGECWKGWGKKACTYHPADQVVFGACFYQRRDGPLPYVALYSLAISLITGHPY